MRSPSPWAKSRSPLRRRSPGRMSKSPSRSTLNRRSLSPSRSKSSRRSPLNRRSPSSRRSPSNKRSPSSRRSSSSRRSPSSFSKSPSRNSPLNRRFHSPPRRRFHSPRLRSRSPRRRKHSPHRRPARSGSPTEKMTVRQQPGDQASGSGHPRGRARYSAKPGPMGRYNSRLEGGWQDEVKIQPTEWTCKTCSEVFHEQQGYIRHVEERNKGERRCIKLSSVKLSPQRGERSGSLQPGSITVISIQDSPPCVSIDLSEEAEVTPTLVDIFDVVSDSELVSPSIMLGTSLDPISDQSLSISPESTKAFPPQKVISDVEGSSPPRVTEDVMQSMVSRRDDGVLVIMQGEGTVQAKKRIIFRKDLFKASVPDLVDIPDNLTNNEDENGNRANTLQKDYPTELALPENQDGDLTKSLESANSLLMILPNHNTSPTILKRSAVKRQLPRCLTEGDDISEPDNVKKVATPRPVDDMELLLDKKKRKMFIKKKIDKTMKIDNESSSMSSTTVSEQRKGQSSSQVRNQISPLHEASSNVLSSSSPVCDASNSTEMTSSDNLDPLPRCPDTETASISLRSSVAVLSSPRPDISSQDTVSLSSPDPASLQPSTLCIPPVVSETTPSLQPSNPLSVSSGFDIPSSRTITPPPVSKHSSSSRITSSSCSPPPVSQQYSTSGIPTSTTMFPLLISSLPSLSSSIVTKAVVSSTVSLTSSLKTKSLLSMLPQGFANTSTAEISSLSAGCLRPSVIVSEAKQSVCLSQAETVKKGGLTCTGPGDGGTQGASPVLPAACPASSSTSAHNFSPSPPDLPPVCTSIIRLSPTAFASQFSPRSSPTHQGEVMSLHLALGGSPDSEDDEPPPQPAVLRAGVDCMDKCPDCECRLETGASAVNFSLNMADFSILVDCIKCGIRVQLKGVLGSRQRAFLSCGV